MNYLDTNILARFITGDVPELADKALDIIKAHGTNELIILDAVLVELFFILENNRQYLWKREKIVEGFSNIIAAPQLSISERAHKAFKLYAKYPKFDFVDCLLLSASQENNKIFTFDKPLHKAVKS